VSGAVCALDVRSVSYGATVALQGVSIELQAGEVHALLGENGAGKSTLVEILSGVVKPNVGTMRIGGEPYEPHSIVDARRRGVATAFQELSLVPNLTVAQNLSLPRQAKGKLGLVSGAATQKHGAAILNRFGLRLSPSAIVAGLPAARNHASLRLQPEGAHPRRADRRPGRDRLALRPRSSGDRRGRGCPLHLASAGRGPRALSARDGSPQRPQHRHGRA
jgi:ABC-type sugar transport system ATPase subunit